MTKKQKILTIIDTIRQDIEREPIPPRSTFHRSLDLLHHHITHKRKYTKKSKPTTQ